MSTSKNSKGLGDKIEDFTKATGIKKVVDTVFDALGMDCGCDARKKWLNEKFPGKKPECLIESEYEVLKEFFSIKKSYVTAVEQKALLAINNRVFKMKQEMSSCGSCVANLVNKLRILYDKYEEENKDK